MSRALLFIAFVFSALVTFALSARSRSYAKAVSCESCLTRVRLVAQVVSFGKSYREIKNDVSDWCDKGDRDFCDMKSNIKEIYNLIQQQKTREQVCSAIRMC
ncbi:keratin, type II cytoskeletal [Acrasis kona]|uniref:Keratin, type II cytoskeletal n=1 Tax=Acrasis kona TaxID=1008807 RepID=A0AAW2YXE1_9EUKA